MSLPPEGAVLSLVKQNKKQKQHILQAQALTHVENAKDQVL